MKRAIRLCLALPLLLGAASCVTAKGARPADEAGADSLLAADAGHETKLRKIARQSFEAIERSQETRRETVVYRKPYYFKEYADYPEGTEAFVVTFHETESRTTPYYAELTIPKIRYSTRLHKSRRDAERDTRFFRDSGAETVSYELRAGRWRRIGSMFISESRQEQVGGEWRAITD